MYDQETAATTIKLNNTTLHGLEDSSLQVVRFLGIPYALPPTGQYRFQKPRKLPQDYQYGEDGKLECKTFPAVCPQPIYKMNNTPMPQPPGTKFSEDCLYVNIWIPKGIPPAGGWPVLSWIHGGWYQTGSPLIGDANNPGGLISPHGAGVSAIIVTIGYRLNIFGFLANNDLNGNFGLWDQRLALEWTYDNIHHFSGNPKRITIAGLSAGANAVHQQINYEFFSSQREPIFNQAIMYSNAISAQSKPPSAAQAQFDEVCQKFDISSTLSQAEKLERLKQIKDTDLASRLLELKYHTFRHVTDGEFISPELVKRGQNGRFAAEFVRRDFRLIVGEVENEESVYRAVNPPHSRAQFIPELENYYSADTSKALFDRYPFQENQRENEPEDWKDHFGRIVAASQVRAPTRRLCSQIFAKSGEKFAKQFFRYRISLRLRILTAVGVPESFGVGHGMDQDVWWFRAKAFKDDEATSVRQWLKPVDAFINGQEVGWGTKDVQEYRRLCKDGSIRIEADMYWDEYQAFADVLMPHASSAQKL
ncbi:protein of unknown function [Taphrina deformans PYCC 5710]|uniref:Carboxylesterase type B domain-containing protein n=1 Tax=Taphrina deformans (strain PYCC 5710 / ATCC 11124 / CBS 356.35 / IMI 108563 / JCM 9778 / NBRC 8474) TaxID=1097556 RepID=R4XK29_TAPDE|nr:protein of unknown function [Taphrina deformans PYCC 5710]|eukprot:CCG84808.1 protein of unknown function [Taphrina deformans PYCC 5710]